MKTLISDNVAQSIDFPGGDQIVLINTLDSARNNPRSESSRNIYRVNSDRNILWQVENYNCMPNSTFTQINYDGSQTLSAYNFDGREFLININTGKIQPGRLMK